MEPPLEADAFKNLLTSTLIDAPLLTSNSASSAVSALPLKLEPLLASAFIWSVEPYKIILLPLLTSASINFAFSSTSIRLPLEELNIRSDAEMGYSDLTLLPL